MGPCANRRPAESPHYSGSVIIARARLRDLCALPPFVLDVLIERTAKSAAGVLYFPVHLEGAPQGEVPALDGILSPQGTAMPRGAASQLPQCVNPNPKTLPDQSRRAPSTFKAEMKMRRLYADSDDCGQGFRLIADSHSN
jgi:hypothetical protein